MKDKIFLIWSVIKDIFLIMVILPTCIMVLSIWYFFTNIGKKKYFEDIFKLEG